MLPLTISSNIWPCSDLGFDLEHDRGNLCTLILCYFVKNQNLSNRQLRDQRWTRVGFNFWRSSSRSSMGRSVHGCHASEVLLNGLMYRKTSNISRGLLLEVLWYLHKICLHAPRFYGLFKVVRSESRWQQAGVGNTWTCPVVLVR